MQKKKPRHGLLITVILFLFVVLFTIRTQIGNLTGSFLHYGTCPNCGDSWFWKSKRDESYTSEHTLYAQIMIYKVCKECLANPAELDETRIERNLINKEWSPEDANSVREAVIRYKKEKLQNQ